MVMCTGGDAESTARLNNLIARQGFTVTNSITHLGFTIDSRLEKLCENWSLKLARMKNLVNAFAPFSPSILCKLDICLMFIYSQLSYVGSVLPPNDEVINEIQKIIIKFLFPSINIFPKNRIFLDKAKGGLGLPPIDLFIKSIRLKFATRAATSTQTWARLLKSYFPFGQIDKVCYKVIDNPLIRDYAENLNKFHTAFFKRDKNFWSCPIFFNENVKDQYQNSTCSPPIELRAALEHKKISDAVNFESKNMLGYLELKNAWNIDLSFNHFFGIRNAIKRAMNGKKIPAEKPPDKSILFVYEKCYKAKFFRSYITDIAFDNIANFSGTLYFARIYPGTFDKSQTANFLKLWSFRALPNQIRQFALMRNNNKLLLNDQRAKFTQTSPTCTFCNFFPSMTYEDESQEHLFFNCRISNKILSEYFNNFIEGFQLKRAIFRGHIGDNEKVNLFINIEILLVLFNIFVYRNERRLPNITNIKNNCGMVKKYLLANKTYRDSFTWMENHAQGNFSRINEWTNFFIFPS